MIWGVTREAIASARSQPVASLLTILMITGMVVAVMLTTGRTVGAEQQVLGTLDSAGTRSVVVNAEQGSGLTSDVMIRISAIDGVEWFAAFTPAVDGTNAAVPDGVRVPVRRIFASDLSVLGITGSDVSRANTAWSSPRALDQLGLPDSSGGISLTSGESLGVVGGFRVPSYLQAWEPFVLVPNLKPESREPVSVVVVVADSPDLVSPVREAVLSVLAADDTSKITIQTSEELALLRGLIEGQLGNFSRGLVIALLGLTGGLVSVLLYGLVLMRRKDFGRRRALGASRALIVTLILVQTTLLASIGVAVGAIGSTICLAITGDPLPGPAFTLALGILALATSLLAALIPAVFASRREPIHELRVP